MLRQFCDKLAREWEIEGGFATGVPGVFAIPIGDGLEVTLSQGDDGYSMSCTLAPCPKGRREEVFSDLLSACFMGQRTRGAVLGLDGDERLLLQRALRGELQYRDFYEGLEDFIEMADAWHSYALDEEG